MKKISAFILAAVMALTLFGCAAEEPEEVVDVITEPAVTEAPVTEAPKVEPPIEIDRFCEPDDMPEADLPELDDEANAIVVDGETYTLRWLYDHNIYDWREAGITFEQVNDRSAQLLGIDYSDEAFEAIKLKVSDFTELMMLSPTADGEVKAGGITVTTGDETVDYDLEWLSSHNATEYTEAGITADVVADFLEAMEADFWYTYEYRWVTEVYNRLVNGF